MGDEKGGKLSLRKGIKGQLYSTVTNTIFFFQIGTTAISVILFPFSYSSCSIYAKIGSNPKLVDLINELSTPENDPKRWGEPFPDREINLEK